MRCLVRPREVPPVRFTEQLVEQRHDGLASEAHALAMRYAQARFGSLPLTGDELRVFHQRVAALRRPG